MNGCANGEERLLPSLLHKMTSFLINKTWFI